MEEIFQLVDADGNVVGKATRRECHSGSMLLHPVVHIHIFNPAGDIYLQRRSMTKDIQPGKWDTAVGGHVDYGETIIEAMLREAREELGIEGFSYRKLFSYVFQSKVERELVNTFVVENFIGTPVVDPGEIDEGRFWSLDKVEANIGRGVFTPNFEQEFRRLVEALGKSNDK